MLQKATPEFQFHITEFMWAKINSSDDKAETLEFNLQI